MRIADVRKAIALTAMVAALAVSGPLAADDDDDDDGGRGYGKGSPVNVQLGPRPWYLVDALKPGKLKRELQHCAENKEQFTPKLFSIGHRGAPLQFPEHTKESYVAAARSGAGILECDVTFTKDAELVCRHAQCDLHTTTDIVARPDLRQHCKVPPEFDPVSGALTNGPQIRCCTSDLTLAQFKTLNGKMDAADRNATTVEGYLGGTARWRTDLYTNKGTLLTHAESIELFDELGTGYTPELKGGDPDDIADVFGSQENYARAMIEEYIDAGIDPRWVWAQSFNLDDVMLWIEEYPRYGKQAVFLDGRPVQVQADNPPPLSEFRALKKAGLNIIAPPMPVLLKSSGENIVPSTYAKRAKRAKLDIITWTLERSGRIIDGVPESAFYYQTTLDSLHNDGDIMRTVDVLAQKVGIIGLFSDWPSTTTFYANCKKVRVGQHHGAKKKRHRGDDDDDD